MTPGLSIYQFKGGRVKGSWILLNALSPASDDDDNGNFWSSIESKLYQPNIKDDNDASLHKISSYGAAWAVLTRLMKMINEIAFQNVHFSTEWSDDDITPRTLSYPPINPPQGSAIRVAIDSFSIYHD